jgi:hypothetical protein
MTTSPSETVDQWPDHAAGLAGCKSVADKIRYACEHNRPNPTTGSVRAWLQSQGVQTRRPYASQIVNAWRREHSMTDTGELPELPEALLAKLEADEPEPAETVAVVAAPVRADAVEETSGEKASGEKASGAPSGSLGFYLVAIMSMAVSVDTSWRFFGNNLHITNPWERGAMFAVVEVALIACGYGMRANVRSSGAPGAPRLFAWLLCGLAAYMAWQLSGLAAGLARVALGPVLGLIMLHLALGIEIRTVHGKLTPWATVGRELRERALSRLGLSDDQRDALARTRDRAARKAARLALGGRFIPWRQTRLARALRVANVAHDPQQRKRMLAELATLRHANALTNLEQPPPW